jgi:hypothetical protein
VARQARAVAVHLADEPVPARARALLRDRDTKFVPEFDDGVRIRRRRRQAGRPGGAEHERLRDQGLGNWVITGPDPPAAAPTVGAVVCEERLCGLLWHCRRRAA